MAEHGPIARWFRRWRGGSGADGTPDGHGDEYWVDLSTGSIEAGGQSPAASRMGPYPTREAAQHAFDTARARNEAWDEEDRRWQDDDWPKGTGRADR